MPLRGHSKDAGSLGHGAKAQSLWGHSDRASRMTRMRGGLLGRTWNHRSFTIIYPKANAAGPQPKGPGSCPHRNRTGRVLLGGLMNSPPGSGRGRPGETSPGCGLSQTSGRLADLAGRLRAQPEGRELQVAGSLPASLSNQRPWRPGPCQRAANDPAN
jgi:hypothetical protein